MNSPAWLFAQGLIWGGCGQQDEPPSFGLVLRAGLVLVPPAFQCLSSGLGPGGGGKFKLFRPGDISVSPSLQVPPGLMLAWASCGHMAESSKLNPLQKLVSSHHTGGQQESEPQSSLGSLPQFPLQEGLEKVTVPWGGGACGVFGTCLPLAHISGTPPASFGLEIPPEASSSERLLPDYNLGGIGPGTSLKTGLFLYKF